MTSDRIHYKTSKKSSANTKKQAVHV